MKRSILDRIAEKTIDTNFEIFPEEINGFRRNPVLVTDDTARSHINHATYSRGNDIGVVTAADIAAGLRQVRKIKQVASEGGSRRVIAPSDEVF